VPLPGLLPPERQFARAAGRIGLHLDRAAQQGMRQLIVTEENRLGAPRANLRAGTLYPHAGMRIGRYLAAFGGRTGRIALSIRSPDYYWASCMAFALARGHGVPGPEQLARLVAADRSWRDVISDIACAAPGVPILVMTHEAHGAQPEQRLWHMTGGSLLAPMTHARNWLNRAPDLARLRGILRDRGRDPQALPAGEGRWMPFDAGQQARMRESYMDDLFWLRAGADGMAVLAEDDADGQWSDAWTGTGAAAEQLPPG